MRFEDYWNSTPAEIAVVFEAHNALQKEQLLLCYAQATMTADFVNARLSGKTIPSIYEVYPDLFTTEEQEEQEQMIAQKQFIEYANRLNAQRKMNNDT